ncbi:uncharacterized protein LOC134194766 isoform X2 [Corticium candelabrum]|uniref:uncharacterized protein LOC134194766 isoform X2 n=1 Tax=Corticium candelabrum TaxID=121492 RepID=UPI002E2546F5|nr:uncharacterized protein LOC134194766 isoform X2 [Corticium candelabrum]
MSVFKLKSTRQSTRIPTAVKISEEDKPLARSDFNVNKITEIQNRFQGGEVLVAAGRIFVREGTLMKVCRKGPKPRQFFLFNDVLVYGTILSRGHYAQQHILSLDQMSVTSECHYMPQVYSNDGEIDLHLDIKNAFQINHYAKSFHIFASSPTDKNNWLSNLSKYISKAQDGRESVQLVTRAVWVPDSCVNDCMGCKKKFTTFTRKHHCRNCGKVVCGQCSSTKVDLLLFQGQTPAPGTEKPERVCTDCYSIVSKSTTNKQRDNTKQVTVIDARPMNSSSQGGKKLSQERPPPLVSEAMKQTSQTLLACAEQTAERRAANKQLFDTKGATTGEGDDSTAAAQSTSNDYEDSGNETTDSDDSEDLDETEKREMQLTRSASILSGSSWNEQQQQLNSQSRLDDDERSDTPQAPPRRKRQGKGQESPETQRTQATATDAHVFTCATCHKVLNNGEYGFLEEQSYCREHFKEKYEQLHGQENEQQDGVKGKPTPVPRKQKEATEDKDKIHQDAVNNTETQAHQTHQENTTEEPVRPARMRKANKFKKAEVKKEEEKQQETVPDEPLVAANLLGDENELSTSVVTEMNVESSPAAHTTVDDLRTQRGLTNTTRHPTHYYNSAATTHMFSIQGNLLSLSTDQSTCTNT